MSDSGDPWVCIFCAQLIDARTLEERWNHLLDNHRAELKHSDAGIVVSRPLAGGKR